MQGTHSSAMAKVAHEQPADECDPIDVAMREHQNASRAESDINAAVLF